MTFAKRDLAAAEGQDIALAVEDDPLQLVPPELAPTLDQIGGQEDGGRNAELFEQRHRNVGAAGVAIVEGQRSRIAWQSALTMQFDEIRQGQDSSVLFEPVHLVGEVLGGNGEAPRIEALVGDPVVHEDRGTWRQQGPQPAQASFPGPD